MRRGCPRDPRKEQFWRDHVQRWSASGLRIRAYCRRYGLAEASFHAWRRTLAARDRAAATAAAAPVELVLPNGWLLRLPAGFAPDSLRAVLALVPEGPPC